MNNEFTIGEQIEVTNRDNWIYPHKAEYLGKFEEFYIAGFPGEGTPVLWKHAREIGKPWIPIIKGEWPDCKPGDKIQIKRNEVI